MLHSPPYPDARFAFSKVGEMSTILCCGLTDIARAFRNGQPSHVVSIRSPGALSWDELGLPSTAATNSRRLDLTFNDLIDETSDYVSPSGSDVEKLISFGQEWATSQIPDDECGSAADELPDGDDGFQVIAQSRPLLIHCQLGISRSTAGVLILLGMLNPAVTGEDLFHHLKCAAPHARPNERLLAIADTLLDRKSDLLPAVLKGKTPYDPAVTPRLFKVSAVYG